MTEMIERVAHEIGKAVRSDPRFQSAAIDLDKAARAALAAMREPTDEMIEAAMKPYLYGNDDLMNAAFRETIAKYWHAMLDEALK
jgi:hypothetical protein